MKKVITAENVRMFAYVNDTICKRPIKGIAVNFMGLGGLTMYDREESEQGKRMAEQGILYVLPYLNPWCWMNPQAVKTTDEIIDAVMERCGLTDVPIVSTGGSMGGLSALIYTRYAKRTPAACVANCPVCDLPYHYTERPDLPRTLYSAFGTADAETLEDAMKKASPLHLALAKDMPKAKYVIFHCEADEMVNKQQHSDRLVAALKEFCDVEYYGVPDRRHCDLSEEMAALYEQKIIQAVE